MAVIPIWWIGKGHRSVPRRRHPIGDPVADQHGDPPLVEPRQGLRVEPRQTLGERVEPSSLRPTPSVATRRHDEQVPRARPRDPRHARPPRGRPPRSRRRARGSGTPRTLGTSRSTPRPATPPATVITLLRQRSRAEHHLGRVPVPHLRRHEDVAQGVEVGGAAGRGCRRRRSHVSPRTREARRCPGRRPGQHVVLPGDGLLGGRGGGQVVGQAHGLPGADQARRVGTTVRGEQCQRPALVALAEAAPVAQRDVEPIELLGGGFGGDGHGRTLSMRSRQGRVRTTPRAGLSRVVPSCDER